MIICAVLLLGQVKGIPVKKFDKGICTIQWQEMPATALGKLAKPIWASKIAAERKAGISATKDELMQFYQSELFLASASPKLISAFMSGTSGMGPASTSAEVHIYNWTSKNGKLAAVTNKDLFRADANWQSRMKAIITPKFVAEFRKGTWADESVPEAPYAASKAVTNGPLVTSNGLRYLIVEPARGRDTVSVDVAWSEVSTLLNPNGPLGDRASKGSGFNLQVPSKDRSDQKLGVFLSNFTEVNLRNFDAGKPLSQRELLEFAANHEIWNRVTYRNEGVVSRLDQARAKQVVKRYFDRDLTIWEKPRHWSQKGSDFVLVSGEGDQPLAAKVLSLTPVSSIRIRIKAIEHENPDFSSGQPMRKISAEAEYRKGRWVLLSFTRG